MLQKDKLFLPANYQNVVIETETQNAFRRASVFCIMLVVLVRWFVYSPEHKSDITYAVEINQLVGLTTSGEWKGSVPTSDDGRW